MDTNELQRLDAFLSDPKVPQEDKNRAVAMARSRESGTTVSGESGTTTPTSRPMGPIEKAGAYVTKRGGQFVGALGRLTTPQGLERPVLEQLGDVATVAGPVLGLTAGPVAGPVMVGGGLLAGGTARALGADEGTAELADMAMNLAGGVESAIRGGFRAARSAKDITEEGTKLRALVPATRQTIAGVTAKKFDPIIEGLEKTGRTIRTGTPEADDLITGLTDALEDSKAAEARLIRPLIEKLTRPAGLGNYGSAPAELTPREIDSAMKALSATGKGWSAKAALNRAMSTIAQGTPMEGHLSDAQKFYHATIVPAHQIVKAMDKALPGNAALAAIRAFKNSGAESRALMDPTGEVAELIKSASKGAKGSMALAGGMGAMGGVAYATSRLLSGDVLEGFRVLLSSAPLMALRAPGVVAAGAKGAAPGLARGIAGAAAPAVPALQNAPRSIPLSQDVQDLQTDEEAPGATQEASPVPGPQAAAKTPQGTFAREIGVASQLTGVPERVLYTIITQESGGQPFVTSRPAPGQAQTPAHGLMQITPGTFKQVAPEVGRLTGRAPSLNDPFDNLIGGALLWKKYLEMTNGDLGAAAKLYHGGENPAYHGPRTQKYAQDITKLYARTQ